MNEDRNQLNRRFINVFNILEERGEVIKNDRNGKGISDFAKRITGAKANGHIIRCYLDESNARMITYSHARALCREYGVNDGYMLEGTGTPFGMDLPSASSSSEQISGNILFTSTEAFAGSSVGAGSFYKEESTMFSLPDLVRSTQYVSFPINGNSMEPVIMNGDIVVCKPVERIEQVVDNEIYAVKHNGAVWVKYVEKLYDSGRVSKLKLRSANHLEHDPFTEEVNIHTKLFKVIKKISDI